MNGVFRSCFFVPDAYVHKESRTIHEMVRLYCEVRSLGSLWSLWSLCLTVEVYLFGSHLADPGEVLLHFGVGHVGINLQAASEEFWSLQGVLHKQMTHDDVAGHVIKVTCAKVVEVLVARVLDGGGAGIEFAGHFLQAAQCGVPLQTCHHGLLLHFLNYGGIHAVGDVAYGSHCLQLGSWVYGMAERNTNSANVSVRYNKTDFLVKDLDVHASLSQTWDHSQTVDTVFRKYYWDGSYIKNASSEIRGRGKSLRHYKRPMTIVRGNAEYRLNDKHSLNLNYVLNRAGNKQYDEMDKTYVPTNDVLVKHIVGLSYNQSFLDGKLNNVFFLKDYINHLKVEQTELSFITGSDAVKPSNTQSYWGYGVGTRLTVSEPWAIKASYEHSVRLPIARELLGNGSTIYPNIALRPESSENFNLGLFGNITLAPSHHLYYEVNGFIRLVSILHLTVS